MDTNFKASWLEVSLIVDGELAEAVADVLARFAPNGVVTESGVRYMNLEDAGTPFGPVSVRAYLPVNESLEETRQKLEEALWYLGRIQPLPPPLFTSIEDQNWMEAWKEHYQPIPIGKRLTIVPAWLDSPYPERIPIKINPGMAFGTGTHPTTQLCLGLLEKYMQDFQNLKDLGSLDVIDVGCGSGILSIAAVKLGAKRVLGVDIDEVSIKNSRENAEMNDIYAGLILGQGSVDEILAGQYPIKDAPLVVVNILAPVIISLFRAGLADLVEPKGTIILSGILQEQVESVNEATQAYDLEMDDQRQMGDWVALVFRKS